MQSKKILSLLGLAQKAGKTASGEFAVEQAVRRQSAFLVIVAADASDNTKKKMKNKTDYYHTPLYVFATKEELGRCIGKEYRSMVAILDRGFAEALGKLLEQSRG